MNLLPLLAVLIIACGGDDPVESEADPSIAGEWTAQVANVMLAWLLPGAMGTDCQFSGRMDEDGDHIEGDLACTGEAPIQSEIVLHRRG